MLRTLEVAMFCSREAARRESAAELIAMAQVMALWVLALCFVWAPAAMGVADAGGAFGAAVAGSGAVGKCFGIVGRVSADVLTSMGIVGASGAGGAAALWASMAHFNFMRLALNIGRMFVAGFSGKRGSPLLRPP